MASNTFGFCVLQEMFKIMYSKIKNQNVPFLKGKWSFLWKHKPDSSWNFSGGMSCNAPGLTTDKYSITQKPGFPLAYLYRFSLSYLYLCIHTYIYIHLVFYRASFELGTRWNLKPNAREFILNSIWIFFYSFVIFLIVVKLLAP